MLFMKAPSPLQRIGFAWIVLQTERHPQIWLRKVNQKWQAQFAHGERRIVTEDKSRNKAAQRLVEAFINSPASP